LPGYDGPVEFVVRGPASAIGGPEIGSNPMECFEGIAPVLVRAGLEAGTIALTAQAEGLIPASATFERKPAVTDAILARAKPIYDLPCARVDVGDEKQHVQYGWTAWTGAEDAGESLDLPELGTVTVRPGVGEGLYWRGESNVPGPLGFVAEDGVCALGVLFLKFAGLQAGAYRLRSAINYMRVNPSDPVLGPTPWEWLAEGLERTETDYCRVEQQWFTRQDGARRCVIRFSEFVEDLEGA
jgi:hypothetical protein